MDHAACNPGEPRRISTRELWQKLDDEGYAPTKRTGERDLITLSLQFGFTSERQGTTQQWFWPPDAAVLDVPGLDPVAALAFSLAREQLHALMPTTTLQHLSPWFARAEAVLAAHTQQP